MLKFIFSGKNIYYKSEYCHYHTLWPSAGSDPKIINGYTGIKKSTLIFCIEKYSKEAERSYSCNSCLENVSNFLVCIL